MQAFLNPTLALTIRAKRDSVQRPCLGRMEVEMEQRILMRGKRWMLWYWPYHVLHPWWGFRHGLDGKSHSFMFWCLQYWWQGRRPNAGAHTRSEAE